MWPSATSAAALSLGGGSGNTSAYTPLTRSPFGFRRRWGVVKRGTMLRSCLVLLAALVVVWVVFMMVSVDGLSADSLSPGVVGDVAGDMAYFVAVDAGSSGSRVQVYRRTSAGVLEESGAEWEHRVDVGLASLAGQDDAAVSEYMRPLLEFAVRTVPQDAHAHTPFYLMATAGMRLLAEDQQRRILSSVCHAVLVNSDFVAEPCVGDHVQVISGESEGLFGWLALNYILGSLRSGATVGFMDLGGASAQIAFEPSPNKLGQYAGKLSNITVLGQRLSVFAASYLGLGVNEAQHRHLASISSPSGSAEDPCLPVGFSEQSAASTETIHGSGNLTQCMEMLPSLLSGDGTTVKCDPETGKPCLIDGVRAPLVDYATQRFVGVSEYWHTTEEVFDLGGAFGLGRLRISANEFCASERSTLEAKYSSGTHDTLRRQCFKAAWVLTLLHEGFGMPIASNSSDTSTAPLEWPSDGDTDGIAPDAQFQSVDRIRGHRLTWTLGAALLLLPDRGGSAIDDKDRDQGGAFEVADAAVSSAARLLPLALLLLLASCALIVRWLTLHPPTSVLDTLFGGGRYTTQTAGVRAWLSRNDRYRLLPRFSTDLYSATTSNSGGGQGSGTRGLNSSDLELGVLTPPLNSARPLMQPSPSPTTVRRVGAAASATPEPSTLRYSMSPAMGPAQQQHQHHHPLHHTRSQSAFAMGSKPASHFMVSPTTHQHPAAPVSFITAPGTTQSANGAVSTTFRQMPSKPAPDRNSQPN